MNANHTSPRGSPVTASSPPKPEWKIGLNVPWSVAWSDEQKYDVRPSLDFPGRMEVVQIELIGQGTPMFAAQHVMRHRLGMAQHFCHVCGRRTLARDRYIFPVQSGGFVNLDDGSPRFAGNVPPVHLACAKRAQKLCPHLSHAVSPPVPYPSEDSWLLPRPDVVPGMETLAKALPPGLKVVFSSYRLYGPRFSKLAAKLRNEYAGR
jgi:hypothetical protein